MGFLTLWLIFITVMVMGGRRRRWYYARMAEAQARAAQSTREGDIELMETRLARLEERMDFTEKLLMERSEGSRSA